MAHPKRKISRSYYWRSASLS